jgi:hypothetical protein
MNDIKILLENYKNQLEIKFDNSFLIDDGDLSKQFLNVIGENDVQYIESEILSKYKTYTFVKSHADSIYLYSLLWKVYEFDPKFCLELSEKALYDPKVNFKQPWIEVLEDSDEFDKIAAFFKKDVSYGDKYFQEKMLYILSESNINIGDELTIFLDSSETILVLAALSVVKSQELINYLPFLENLFTKSEDTDIIIETAEIIIEWTDTSDIILHKIMDLKKSDANYFADCIDDLEELIS